MMNSIFWADEHKHQLANKEKALVSITDPGERQSLMQDIAWLKDRLQTLGEKEYTGWSEKDNDFVTKPLAEA